MFDLSKIYDLRKKFALPDTFLKNQKSTVHTFIVNKTKIITIERFPNMRQLAPKSALNMGFERKVLSLSQKSYS